MLRSWLCSVTFLVSALHGATFHFAIVGDRTGRAVPGVYEAVWKEVKTAHPDFVVTVGDAIEGMDVKSAKGEWEAVRRSWPKDIPVYHTPGNHDVWDTASGQLFTEETGRKLNYSWSFGGAHFVVLDNSRVDGLPPEALEFLRSDLGKRAGVTGPTFVFFHRNYWLLPLKLRVDSLPLLDLAKANGVCCVISGHGHQFQAIQRDGVEFLEVGSSGAEVGVGRPNSPGYPDGWFYQYVWVTVDGPSVTFEIRELGPPLGQGRRRLIEAGTER